MSTALEHLNSPRIAQLSFDILLRLLEKKEESGGLRLTAQHVDSIITLIHSKAAHLETQRLGCMVLGCASVDRPEFQQILHETNGRAIAAVGLTMQAHPNSSRVQQWGCWALFNMCKDSMELKQAMVKHKALDRVIQAMKQHPSHKETQLLGALAINNCCLDVPSTFRSTTIALAVSQGLVPILQNAMHEFVNEEQIQQLGKLLLTFAAQSQSPPPVEDLE